MKDDSRTTSIVFVIMLKVNNEANMHAHETLVNHAGSLKTEDKFRCENHKTDFSHTCVLKHTF